VDFNFHMKKRIFLFLTYFLFWFLFFIVSRILFLTYSFRLTLGLSFTDLMKVFLYGSRMDLSVAGYISLVPGLIFVLTSYFKGKVIAPVLNVYTFLVIFITCFLVVADVELYRNWGFRMDSTPLMYLKNPKEAIISANGWIAVALIIFLVFFVWLTFKAYRNLIGWRIAALGKSNWITSLVFLFLTSTLILPIRGGLDVAPMNNSFVYFHPTNVYANHAAINVVWNVGSALAYTDKLKVYTYMDKAKADHIFEESRKDNGQPEMVLNSQRPNVIVIIMESFTAKLIEALGGVKGVTPNIDALRREGILFDHCYATGDRTDKGIITVLSGYPPMPRTSIISFSKKTEKLPFLNKDFKKRGYYSEFIYGGDIDFANFKSYFVNAGYDKIISKKEFDPSQYNSKWGAHDQHTFHKLLDECNRVGDKSFFMTLMTLSSHEPFEVPMKTVIQGNDEEHRYLNSAYYTDSSLGDFIRQAKQTSWWKNTLVVIVADHGSRLPGNTSNYVPLRFHIPLLWLGGALAKRDTVIHTICSQADIPVTVLRQVGIINKDYKFSNDILSSTAPAFGFYVYNDGFGFVKKGSQMAFDNVSNKVIFEEGNVTDSFIEEGKAQMQVLSGDFVRR
jgi:phosphoglycerol transferase MdoB-like AlkP superfamily enzyme